MDTTTLFIILDLSVERGSGFRSDISGWRERYPLLQSSLGMLFLTFNPSVLQSLVTFKISCYFEIPKHISAAFWEESTIFCAGLRPVLIPSPLSMTSPFTLFKTVVFGYFECVAGLSIRHTATFDSNNCLVQVLISVILVDFWSFFFGHCKLKILISTIYFLINYFT